MTLVERQATYARSPAGTPRRGEAGEASSSGTAGSAPTRATQRAVTPPKSPRKSPPVSPLASHAKLPKTEASKRASSKSPKAEKQADAPAPAPARPPPPPESPAGYLGAPFRYDFGDDDGGGSAPRVPSVPSDDAVEPSEKHGAAPERRTSPTLSSAPAAIDPPRPPRVSSTIPAASTSASGSLHDTHALTERLHASETARREAERRLARAAERARVMEEILEEQNALLENVPTVIAAGGAERWRARLGAGGGYGAEATGVRRRLNADEGGEVSRDEERSVERERERAV